MSSQFGGQRKNERDEIVARFRAAVMATFPRIHGDILYTIAEKLLTIPPEGPQFNRKIDFRWQNCYTNFMFLNEMAMRTIISQFVKFKRIEFIKFRGEEQIQFYKNDSFDDLESEEFLGPYIVPKGMLEYIIENGKFRVNEIVTIGFIPDDHSIDIKELGEMNSLKAFCALFLGKQIQIPDGLNNNLMVKKFQVNESLASIQKNLEGILAIDALELEIVNQGQNIIIDCSQYKSPIIANNTTKITIDCQFDFGSPKEELNKFAINFETFCSFLVRVCPNLNNLHINSWIYVNSIEFFDNLYSTIKAMEAGIKSINIGNEHMQISIELLAYLDSEFYDDLPLQSHDLFKLGSPFTMKNAFGPYIARSLECVDVLGRIHKLQFKFAKCCLMMAS